MTIKARNLRALIRDVGAENYRGKLRELLGIETKHNPEGVFPARLNESKAQIHPSEFSIRDLYDEFLGGEFTAGMHNTKTSDHYTGVLREALNPVTASSQININALSATVGGLLEARILKGYDRPENIADKLMDTEPTQVNGGKMIGLPGLNLPSDFVGEGQEYPSVGIGERWVVAQKNVKYGQKLAVTREDVVYDRTGQILAAGEEMGRSLSYVREYWCSAVVQGEDIDAGTAGFLSGRTANTFIYKGAETDTPNATYQTSASGKYNYVNRQQNVLADYSDFQNVQSKLNLMREFETGLPILAPFNEVIVSPNNVYVAKLVINATQVLNTTGTNGLSGVGVGTFAGNPIPNLTVYSSPIWNKQLVDSGVSQANADIRWYGGSFKPAFVWREVWGLSLVQSNPLVPEMLERDIVNAWFASWYGVPVVRDPHYVIENTE